MSPKAANLAGEPEHGRAPREESRPVQQLTPDQAEAAKTLQAFLRDLANRWRKPVQDPGRAPRFLPEIDKDRLNRVFLIEGGRGSGKSALLVTLIEDWTKVLRDDVPSPRWPVPGLVPLLFDLHPLPPSTHLLLHLIGQLYQVAQWIEGQRGCGGSEDRPPWHLGDGEEAESIKQWRALRKAAALGWDGNLRLERKTGELEAYISELEDVERSRLHLQQSFHAFMDALVRDLPKQLPRAQRPLFLICIDDADMTPERTVEVLDLCRLLDHPRLTFVLTGQDSLFEVALRAHILGTLRRPLRSLYFNQHEQLALGDLAESARLAGEFYDKIIPPPQRLRLRPLRAKVRLDGITGREDSLDGAPLASGGPGGGSTPPRGGVQVSPANPSSAMPPTPGDLPNAEAVMKSGVRDLLQKPPGGDPSGPDLACLMDQNPTLLYALPDRLRALIDFREFLKDLRNEEPQEEKQREDARANACRTDNDNTTLARPEAQILAYLWNQALDRSVLPGDLREQLRDAVRPSHSARGVVVSGSSLLKFKVSGRILSEEEFLPGFQVCAAEPFWTLHVHEGERSIQLPDSALSAIMLAVDYALGDPLGSRLRLQLPALPAHSHPVFVQFHGTDGRTYQIPWPLPAWRGFTALMSLARRWRDLAPKLDGEPLTLLTEYLSLVLDVSGQPPAPAQSKLGALCARITSLAALEQTESARDRAAVEWARRGAPLLSAPEYGLPAKLANEWLELLTKDMKADRRADWSRARRDRLRQAARGEAGPSVDEATLANQITGQLSEPSEYSWLSLVGGGATGDTLEKLLQEFPVERPTAPYVPGPGNLLGYCHGAHRQRWLREIGAEKREEIMDWLRGSLRANTHGRDGVLTIWNRLIAELPERRSLEKIVRWEEQAKGTFFYVHVDYERQVEDERRLAIALEDGREMVPRRVSIVAKNLELAPYLEGFLRVAYDVGWDEEDGKGDPTADAALNPFRPWWRGISIRVPGADLPGHRGFTWPAPSWPALLDWEQLYEAWPGWVRTAAGLPPEERVDRLAYAYCIAMQDLFDSRQVSARARSAIERSYPEGLPWSELANQMYNASIVNDRRVGTSPPSRRAYYYYEWCKAFPLLGAPESGLSIAAAAAILDKTQAISPGGNFERGLFLCKLRRGRVAYHLDNHRAKRTQAEESQVTSVLEAIDVEFPEHPWVQLLGRAGREPPESSGPQGHRRKRIVR